MPEALAYAEIAGVPVQYGLYAAALALVAYAMFGTSRRLFVEPSSTVAAVSAAVVAPLLHERRRIIQLSKLDKDIMSSREQAVVSREKRSIVSIMAITSAGIQRSTTLTSYTELNGVEDPTQPPTRSVIIHI